MIKSKDYDLPKKRFCFGIVSLIIVAILIITMISFHAYNYYSSPTELQNKLRDYEKYLKPSSPADKYDKSNADEHSIGFYISLDTYGYSELQDKIDDIKIGEVPIISDKDIIYYQWEKHTMRLTNEATERIRSITLAAGLEDLYFIVFADGIRCYVGAFKIGFSSSPFPYPVIMCDNFFSEDSKTKTVLLVNQCYYCDSAFNHDFRENKRVKSCLIALGKLR